MEKYKIEATLKPNESAIVKVRHRILFHKTFRVTNMGKDVKIERLKGEGHE